MFLLFGVTSRTSTVSEGTFACPVEGASRPYRHQRVRKWFTLFFVPVLPLGRGHERVQCLSCGAMSAANGAAAALDIG